MSRRVLAASPSARLHRASGILALCVLADSALEHYRGSFHNRAMLVPLVSATLAAAANARRLGGPDRSSLPGRLSLPARLPLPGRFSLRARPPHRARRLVHALAMATGLIGTGFHVYNIRKRIGGFSFLNFFYGAPVAAPAALVLSGLLGLAAEQAFAAERRGPLRKARDLALSPWRRHPRPSGEVLALLTSLGIAGTVGEAALLHFRGAFHNKAMYLPVTLPPLAAATLGLSALSSRPGIARAARRLLRAVGLLGIAGTAFHAFGVSRGMGGWRNWTQNLLDGPPLPAPPSFTALTLAGLAALDLQRAKR